jgi:glucose dehydrogenase
MTYTGPGGKQYVAVLSGVGGWAGIGLAAGLTNPAGQQCNKCTAAQLAGLGAVNAFSSLSNYTTLGGTLMVFSL